MRTAVYAGTANLYDAMRVACTSLLLNNRVDRVYLLTEGEFPYKMPEQVKVINVSGQEFFPPGSANYRTRWTYMSILRVALTKILSRNKKVLWLDCDTIVDGDISGLFSLDMGNNYFAGVTEPDKSKGRIYINAGVLLLNLDQIRKDGHDNKLIEILNHNRLSLPDQDAINDYSQGKIIPVPSRYNVCPFTDPTEIKLIYHFAANMFFRSERLYKKYEGEHYEKDTYCNTLL